MAVKRVAVIGAGAAGLCAVRHLKARPELFDPVCFELSSRIGGTWVYTEKTGLDEHRIPIQSSMYRNLRTNLPKEVMAFDTSFLFKKTLPSFIGHEDVLRYLESYAEHYQLYQHIKFNSMVKLVSPDWNSGSVTVWKVTYCDVTQQKILLTEEFDAVIVCNGHYTVPLLPTLPGQGSFHGQIIHSHNYRHPEDFQGQRVVCLGAQSSGEDITIDIARSAKVVYISHNKPPLKTILPENVEEHSGISRLTENSVIFNDGEERRIDALVLCTGYCYHFPFLSDDCRVNIEDERVTPLYRHLIHIDHPTLAFIGIPKYVSPLPLFDMQIRFFLATLDGSFKLPSREKMLEEEENEFQGRCVEGLPARKAHNFPGARQWVYNNDLADLANTDRIPQVIEFLYDDVLELRKKDIVGYKRFNYKLLDSETYREIDTVSTI